MKAGYGQLFLLLLAIGAIFLATSGKGYAVWSIFTGNAATPGDAPAAGVPLSPKEQIQKWDDAQSGQGGTRT